MRVYPVVHIHSPDEAAKEAAKAFEADADGVYLIDHDHVDVDPIFETFNRLAVSHQDRFIGINILGSQPAEALEIINAARESGQLSRTPDGLWCDDIRSDDTLGEAMELKQQFLELRRIKILGGVAFKYTSTYTDSPARAAQEAKSLEPYTDVVTTSGKGTGSAPEVAKLKAMKQSIHKHLAVASGISIANLDQYKGIVDEVLVASSIETAPYSGVFDDDKLKSFISRAHEL